MKSVIALGLSLLIAGAATAAENPLEGSPETAASPAEIKKALVPFKGFGNIKSVHYTLHDKEIFAAWYCPFSGEDASYFHAYYLDGKSGKWKRFANELIRHSHDLSPTVPYGDEALVLIDTRGKETRRYDLSKFGEMADEEAK